MLHDIPKTHDILVQWILLRIPPGYALFKCGLRSRLLRSILLHSLIATRLARKRIYSGLEAHRICRMSIILSGHLASIPPILDIQEVLLQVASMFQTFMRQETNTPTWKGQPETATPILQNRKGYWPNSTSSKIVFFVAFLTCRMAKLSLDTDLKRPNIS